VLVLGVALVPRMMNRDLFPTSDEDSWMRRTGGFTYGLVHGQLGRTYQNGHPGVTTMWIALASQGVEGAYRFADRVHGLRYVAKVPGYMEGLATARIGFAVLGALMAAALAVLATHLFGQLVGVFVGVGLAVEPFVVANSQLVHVDGPLAAFSALAVMLAVMVWIERPSAGWLVVTGVAVGLAALSKVPAIIFAGVIPLFAVVGMWWRNQCSPRHWLISMGLCGLAALVTWMVVWPAVWVLGPIEVLSRMLQFSRETGGQPDEVGSYFLGVVSGDPGPGFYPVSTLMRLSPFATIGLVLAAFAAWRVDAGRRLGLLLLAGFCIAFVAMMTVGPKKFDRYVLPIFPILLVIGGVGWAWAVLAVGRTAARLAIGALAVGVAVAPLWAVHPYPLAHYNQLLGGGSTAQRLVMVGNGEGMDQVAAWIRGQPNAADLWTVGHSYDIYAALIPGDGEPLREGVPTDADYIVTYGRRIQMRRWGPSLDRYLEANPPVHRVVINGIEYARIHPGPHLAAR
jgi:hypothetical protein